MNNNPFPKVYVVNFWQDGCTAVSPGCDNCMCHGAGLLPSRHGHAAARLDKINKHSFAIGGTPHLVFIQDDCDVWSDHVDEGDYRSMVDAISSAQAVNLVISTRYIVAMEHRAPKHWLEGHWPANLGLMISVSNQREAERDIPKLLAAKLQYGIPWVGVRIEPMLGEISLRKLTLQALANPRQRGRQWLNALTGEISGVTDPRHAPKTRFGALDWVTVRGEDGDAARPIHHAWMHSLIRDCASTGTPLRFRGWGEWIPHCELTHDQAHLIELNPNSGRKTERMMMYRHGGTESDYPDELMEFFRLGTPQTGAMVRGQFVLAVPNFPRRESQRAA